MHVNLSRNRLATKFAQSLAKFLLGNSTLLTFDISSNPIGEAGAESLLKTLSDHNDSLESLGTLEKDPPSHSVVISLAANSFRSCTGC